MISPVLSSGLTPLARAAGVLRSFWEGLLHYWPFDETSGIRYDAKDTRLTAKFVSANSEFLETASDFTLPSGSFMWAVWADEKAYQAFTAYNPLVNVLGNAWNTTCAWSIHKVSGWSPTRSNNAAGYSQASTGSEAIGSPPVRWRLVWGWWDNAATKCKCAYDGGAELTAGGVLANPVAGPYKLRVGADRSSGTLGYANGNIGAIAVWNRILDQTERTAFWNSGRGKKYADLTTDEKNGLEHFWNMDEVSGTRYDSVGTAHLTDGNTVVSVRDAPNSKHLTDVNTVGPSPAGPAGAVANFVEANSERLSVADNATTTWGESGNGASVSLWYKPTAGGGAYAMLFGRNGSGRNFEVHRDATGSGTNVYFNIGTPGVVGLNTNVGLTNGEWVHLVCTFDPADKKSRVYANGVITADSPSVAAAFATLSATSDAVTIGGWSSYGTYNDAHMGRIGVWDRCLSAAEALALFNSGRGKAYSDLTAAEKVSLVSYWNLDEASGQRNDSHGTNHLTDNNTVGYVINNSGGAAYGTSARIIGANNEYLQNLNFVFPTSYTASVWFNQVDNVPASAPILSCYNAWTTGNQATLYTVGASNPVARVLVSSTTNYVYQDSAVYFFGVWNHVVWQWNDSTKKVKLWLNGTYAGESSALTGTPYRTYAPLYFGTAPAQYNGKIDEVAIFSTLLDTNAIAALYAAGVGKFYPN